MTESGTFVINGAERVIVSQLVRSPGVYYKMDYDRSGKELFSSTIIPNRGAWLEYENDVNDVFYVRIDKNRKIPITVFIRCLGLGTDQEILDFFGDDDRMRATIEKDTCKTMEEGLFEIYRKLRPSEPPPSRARRPISTACSSTPAGTTSPAWAAINTTKNCAWRAAWWARCWPSLWPTPPRGK